MPGPGRAACFPRLVQFVPDKLCELYGLEQTDLDHFPRSIPLEIQLNLAGAFLVSNCLDISTIEAVARRRHGAAFVAKATKALVAVRPNLIEGEPWDLNIAQPVSMGLPSLLTLTTE
jgi:hypothetical protein